MNSRLRLRRGFTLIEVLVALFIVALGIGALLSTLTSAASTVDHLRDKSFAEWIALNRITQTRLTGDAGATGSSSGEVDYAGSKWYWRQSVVDQRMADMLRIDVTVSRNPDPESAALATAVGFMGSTRPASSGRFPEWTVEAARDPPSSSGKRTQ